MPKLNFVRLIPSNILHHIDFFAFRFAFFKK